MNLIDIHRDIVEVIARSIDAKDQVSDRVLPHLVDHSRWKERYAGLDNPATISLNTFRYEVDSIVAQLISIIRVDSE